MWPIVEGKVSCAQGLGVVTGPDCDTLYLTDLFTYRKVDGLTGKITTISRMHSATPPHIHYPFTFSVDEQSVMLTSWFTGTVQEIDRLKNKTKKTLTGFKAPSHAVKMDDGSLLVAEISTGNLIKVTDNGQTIVAKGFAAPTYIAIGRNKVAYATEYVTGNVVRVDLETGRKKTIAQLDRPEGMAISGNGKLIVVETDTGQLVKIDPFTGTVRPLVINLAVGFPAYPGGPPPPFIAGVAISRTGAIYVSGDLENVIYKILLK